VKILHHPVQSDIQLSSVLYALSDPVRLYLLSIIYKTGERTCGDIDVPVVKSTLSHHIRTLREAGVIHVRIQGTQRFISLRTEDLEIRFPGLLASVMQGYESSGESAHITQDQ
jgi:DNA-binding transcriptional ArsR family regulator